MKFTSASSRFRHAGFFLIECLMYLLVVVVVLGVATFAFARCWDDSKHLRRNAEDIVQALHAGEQWRADLRAATGPIKVSDQDGAETLVIPVRFGHVVYGCAQGVLRRQAGTAPATILLANVKSSQMQPDQRPQVTAWRWELELKPTRKQVRMPPLFTFESVPARQTHQ